MDRMQISVLGGFQVRSETWSRVSFGRRKAEALLAYLALHPGQPQPREKLASLLWGETDEARARASLRQAVASIRRALGDMGSSVLVADKAVIALHVDPARVDACEFERLAGEDTIDSLERAASLYRGDLLTSCDVDAEWFNVWLEGERTRFRDLAIDCFARLESYLEKAGADRPAIDAAHRLLALNALDEGAHRALMRLYARSGRRTLALRQFHRCRQILKCELNVEPETDTWHLYRRLRLEDGQSIARRFGSVREKAGTGLAAPVAIRSAPPAVVVLPFAVENDSREATSVATGLREDVIVSLTKTGVFPVVHSGPAEWDQKLDTKEVTAQIGARYVVEGSVRKRHAGSRVTVCLVDVATGYRLWADQFELRPEVDAMERSGLGHRISARVRAVMEKSEYRRCIALERKNHGAWELYLRGKVLLDEAFAGGVDSDAANVKAREMFRNAMESNSNYSKAYAGFAHTYLRDLALGHTRSPEDTWGKLNDSVQRALTIDATDAYAQWVFGYTQLHSGGSDAAVDAGLTAVALDPSDAHAHAELGTALSYSGRHEAAIPHLLHSIRLNRCDPQRHMFMNNLALVCLNARRYEDAAALARRVANGRRIEAPLITLAACLGHLGKREEAEDALRRCELLHPGFVESCAGASSKFKTCLQSADYEHLLTGLRRAG